MTATLDAMRRLGLGPSAATYTEMRLRRMNDADLERYSRRILDECKGRAVPYTVLLHRVREAMTSQTADSVIWHLLETGKLEAGLMNERGRQVPGVRMVT